MPDTIGAGSLAKLGTCHPDLQRLVREVYRRTPRPITVLCGWRGKVEQDAAFKSGASKLRWPNSKHNQGPSLAVDLAPYPVVWVGPGALEAFEALRALVLETAQDLDIQIRVISWDMPHFELVHV